MSKGGSRRKRWIIAGLVASTVLTAVLVTVTVLVLPNIVTLEQNHEVDLAIARAEAVNMAVASFVQANGENAASEDWDAMSEQEHYKAIGHFLAFAPETLEEFVPVNYRLELPQKIVPLTKAKLFDENDQLIAY